VAAPARMGVKLPAVVGAFDQCAVELAKRPAEMRGAGRRRAMQTAFPAVSRPSTSGTPSRVEHASFRPRNCVLRKAGYQNPTACRLRDCSISQGIVSFIGGSLSYYISGLRRKGPIGRKVSGNATYLKPDSGGNMEYALGIAVVELLAFGGRDGARNP